MSLINQMLKDLESRSKPALDMEMALSGLGATINTETGKVSKKYIVVSFFLLIVLSFFLFRHFDFFSSHHKTLISQPQAASSSIKPEISSPGILPNHVMPSVLTGIAMQAQTTVTNLRFMLNQDTLYKVNTDKNHSQITLTFDRTNLIADLPPLDYLKSAVKNIVMSNTANGDLKVTILLNPGADVQQIDWVGSSHSPELQLDLAYVLPEEKNVSEKMPAIASIKKSVMDFNAEQEYEKAIEYLKAGQKGQSMQLLTTLLATYPEFSPARETLAGLYLEMNEKEKAKQIITIGLQQKPYFPPFVQLKARLMVEEGKIIQALDLLQRAAPDARQNPDYHAFMAALYQRTGKANLAAQIYEKLLVQQPTKATWWAGLGVALDSLGKTSEAKEAYMRADRNDELNPELRAYVESRLNDV